MSDEKDFIQISLKKNNPRPGAETYKIETVQDIFNCITPENHKRFLADFECVIDSIVLMKSLPAGDDHAGTQMPYFEWTDD